MSEQGDEDAASILLDDTRSRRISQAGSEAQDPERQFLVGNDEDGDEHLEDEVRSFRSSASMDEDRNQHKHKYGSLMQNDSARMSHLDVHGAGVSGSHLEDGTLHNNKPKDGNLAAKAGIILVSVTNGALHCSLLMPSYLYSQGIHNVFIVIPQFIITGISSIIFAITGAGEVSEPPPPGGNSTVPEIIVREGPGPSGGGPNSYAYVFRYVLDRYQQDLS